MLRNGSGSTSRISGRRGRFSGPAAAQTLQSQPALQRSLATWQASQDTFEVERARQTVTANDAVTALTAAFKNPQAGQFMMTVANKDPNTGQRTRDMRWHRTRSSP